jgi:hypothetical protein
MILVVAIEQIIMVDIRPLMRFSPLALTAFTPSLLCCAMYALIAPILSYQLEYFVESLLSFPSFVYS